jgi:hypothetical protein
MQANEWNGPVAMSGRVHVDCQTGDVMRVQDRVEQPPDLKVRMEVEKDVRYGWTVIAGTRYLLAQEVEELARYADTLTRVRIQYRDYRKYSADSKITY